jgi:hypothetical protein
VHITRSAETDALTAFADLDALPAGAGALFAQGAGAGLFGSRAWFRTVIDHGMPEGARACFAVWPDPEAPLALFPLRRAAGASLASLTTPYSCLYAPLLAASLDADGLARAGAAFGRFCRPSGVVRLDALDGDAPALAALLRGVGKAGLAVRRFDHFGNWHEPVGGLSWDAYLEARPGALRETVRRKLRRAERDPAVSITLATTPDETERSIEAFEAAYRRSWKEPEPFPRFNAGLMRETARLGVLRLGVLRIAGEPAAAQLWTVEHGRASVLKLAHDEAFKSHSPGTVLTAWMLRRLLHEERVAEIDFGRGDDPYKRQWASRRRQRIGVLLLNPLHPRGLAALARHEAGRARRRARTVLVGR